MEKCYRFYGWQSADVPPCRPDLAEVSSPRELYDLLFGLWCRETCAPRMRAEWSPQNPTRGQCSITAFLVQDIFGGVVRGIPLPDGNYHCYNEVCGKAFDLTSEQFADGKLDYSPKDPIQLRQFHFGKEEKRRRYELLKEKLEALLRAGASAEGGNRP